MTASFPDIPGLDYSPLLSLLYILFFWQVHHNLNPNIIGLKTKTDTYKHLVQECFPKITVSTIRFVGGGTHRVFEVNGYLMFKFPHGNSGECLLTERRVCEQLKPAVSFQIPKYRYFSEGCPDFPYPIAAYQKLSGIVLERCLLEESFVNAVAIQIGRILSEFHKIPITGELEHMAVPHDPLSHKPDLEGFYHKTRHQVFPHLSSTQRDWTRCLFEEFLDDDRCWRFVPTLIHGDFDSSNILYDPCRGIVCGIIDFEEVGVGDPACDFCSLLDEYGQRFLDQVLQNYTAPIDDCLPKRVEFHARRIIFCEILYGVESGEDEFLEHGMERLHHAIAGDEIIGGWLPKSTSRNRTVAGFPE